MKKIILTTLFIASVFIGCDSDKSAIVFNYDSIMYKEFRFNIGKVTPITINSSVETDGDISEDGKYFYYTSNEESGNYDIYLRTMNDITTVRVTDHPSKDISPVISPNGKKLAFVSFRTDPEGDIFIMKMAPGKLIKETKKNLGVSSKQISSRKIENLTEEKTPSGIIRNIKDSSPAWSRDGKKIAFSSTRNGRPNIWIMDDDGSNKKQLTSGGGDFPAFSLDGRKLFFISYKDSFNGEVYSLDLETGKKKRLTYDSCIKLYPSPSGKNLIYTSIERDTNGNGKLDLNDRAVIRFHNISEKFSYPITRRSRSSLKAKWLPILKTSDFNGIMVYSSIHRGNININLLPETGIIPKKINARSQYKLCDKFLNEYQDMERYIMSLNSVYYYYGKEKSLDSAIYVDRALGDALEFYRSKKNRKEQKFILGIIKKRVKGGDKYAQFILNAVNGKSPKWQKRYIKANAKARFAPFAMEDLGNMYFKKGKKKQARKVYEKILRNYPKYERALAVNNRINFCLDIDFKRPLPKTAVKVFNKGSAAQKINLIKHIVGDYVFNEGKTPFLISNLEGLKKKYAKDKNLYPIVGFSLGLSRLKKGDRKGAIEEFRSVLKVAHPNDLTSYYSNVLLGRLLKKSKRIEADDYLFNSVSRYSRRFKDRRLEKRIYYLISRFKERGAVLYDRKDYASALKVYEKYKKLLDKLFSKRIYGEIYEKKSPEAQLLYIDTYISLKGSKGIWELAKRGTDRLNLYRIEFNKPYLYGLAYINTLKAMAIFNRPLGEGSEKNRLRETLMSLREAMTHIEWAIFIDDNFIEPYLLKSWIYQFIDSQRLLSRGSQESLIGEFFPPELFEQNIEILKKALVANDESKNPENEGNIQLNMGNNFFLLTNYTKALESYGDVLKYKKYFNSNAEKAMFHFHYAYCLWQNGIIPAARKEMILADSIYDARGGGFAKIVFMKYFALFSRYEKNYDDALFWYGKILRYSQDHGIKVDRARFLQEIALCHFKLGNEKEALKFIAKSKRLLKSYPNDKRVYGMKLKLFGFLPIFSYDLGPDAVVIGKNKIFCPLTRYDKKLVNFSLEEDMALSNGEYERAISILKKKVDSIEGNTVTSNETRITGLNNLGFYYFKLGKFKEAEEFFTKAREMAMDRENLQGNFATTMNLVSLYSYIHAHHLGVKLVTRKKITELSADIEKYQAEYESVTYKILLEDLKKEAKLKKQEVTQEELRALKEIVHQEGMGIYYKLDSALASLKFLNGELLAATMREGSPKKIYEDNREIMGYYSGALELFNGAAETALSMEDRDLYVRLLLNIALCNEKLGQFNKAYVTLIDARDFAVKNNLAWQEVLAKTRLGFFLIKERSKISVSDIFNSSMKLFKDSAEMMLESPHVYAEKRDKVAFIFNEYADLLKKEGREKSSAYVMKRRQELMKALEKK